MNFEREKKMFSQNIPVSKQEKQKSKFYNLGEYKTLEYHLKYKMLADCIKDLGKQKVRLVDYGCGNGRLTNILSTLSDGVKELSNIKIEIIGYEPDEKMVEKTIKRNGQSYFNCVRHTSEKPNEDADIVLCHFSLHHMDGDIEKILEEEIKRKINPQYLIIGEFDYTGNNIGMEEFEKLFLSTDKGKKEFSSYQKEYGGDNGLQVCYNDHMKIGLQECLDALEKAGYDVEDVAMGNIEIPSQAMKFLVKAKRAELDKANFLPKKLNEVKK